jgi:HTH-type transcriptional regulator / antitoxin MqsA
MRRIPRNYPETMVSAESGRPMTRGEKLVSFKIVDREFSYKQPGWWCSLTDPDDMEGQLVDEDNQIAEMARRTARAISQGETVFVPIVIRAIRERCGLTQREAGELFGGGENSFDKYERGEIRPSGPMRRLLKLAMERPDLFRKPEVRKMIVPTGDDERLVRETLRAVHVDRIYERLFEHSPPRPQVAKSGS